MKNPQLLSVMECEVNHYLALGVKRSASFRQIENAYLKLRNSPNPKIAKGATAAWRILGNAESRTEYDAWHDMGGMDWSGRSGDVLDHALPGNYGSKR